MTYAPNSSLGSFISTFQEFPVQNLDEMRRVLTKMYTDLAQAANIKENALYEQSELMTGQQFYTLADNQKKRFTFRKCFETGAIATGATATIAHGISPLVFPTNIYGVVTTDAPDWRPLPFPSAVGNDITIRVTATDIIIQNNGAGPNILSGIAILEYIKN
jgi:hypothetical protein